MIFKHWKKILAMLLCAVMVFANSSLTSQALEAGQTVKAAGSFVLTASTKSQVVIEPEIVEYQEGQTIRDALRASNHTFDGIDDGSIISVVDGIGGSYNIFCNDGGYDLDRAANLVTTVEFTELAQEEVSLEGRADLLLLMENYLSMENEVQSYAPAFDAYSNALTGLRTANADMQSLYSVLETEIENYDKVISGNDITVTVEAVQDGTVLSSSVITFTDENGYVRETEGNSISLGLAGEYHFCISDGGFNRTEGTINVPEGDTALAVELPSGEWFGDIKVTRPDFENEEKTSRVPYTYTQDTENHRAEYFIEDSYDYEEGTLLYIFAEQGEEIPDATATTLRTVYTGLDGEDKSESYISWENTYAQLSAALNSGMDGREISLEAWYNYSEGNKTYRMIQSYDVSLTRIPTCENIVLKDENGVSLLNGFDGETYEYDVNTSSAALSVEAATFGADGYSVAMEVNGNTVSDMTATLNEGSNDVSVIVSHENGQSNTYLFHVTLNDACTVTMQPQGTGYAIEVFNKNDSKISPTTGNVYSLIPGETYYYIATKNGNYHTTAEFTAEDGKTVSVAEPAQETALEDIALYDISSIKNRQELETDSGVSGDVHNYNYIISDAINGNAYVQATPAGGYSVKALYENVHSSSNDREWYEKEISAVVDSTQSATSLTRAYVTGGYGNVITLRAFKDAGTCTYYQDFELTLKRSLSLKALEASTENGNCLFFDSNETMVSFERDTLEYSIYVSAKTETLFLKGQFMNEADPEKLWFNGGYYAMVDGERYNSLSDVTIALDTEKEAETIEIAICHENGEAVSRTYLLNVERKQQIGVQFQVIPKEAFVFVVNQLDGSSVYPDAEGIYQLMPGFSYTYTVTAYGYIGKSVKDYQPNASSDSVRVTVRLNEAVENADLKELSAKWPTFRDKNNNVVIDEPIPTTAEETVLYWALGRDSNRNDDVIDGFDGNCGHPILVDGYLYTYDNQYVYKIDTVDGKIAAVSPDKLVSKSSFAIQGMTYGEGMIFVGLSNGSIQAFNADTLESLWVYKDALGGQPNSQIVYKNGYIYTGFWIGEAVNANYVCISVTDEDTEDHFEEKLASWVYNKRGGFYWVGAYVTDEFMLVGTDDGENGYNTGYAHLLSLNPMTGEVIEDFKLPHTGDLRCSITYDENGTGDYYFTTEGGYFYRISVNENGTFVKDSLQWIYLENGTDVHSKSTSTPTIYNGRAYVGVCGSGQFEAYSGHNVSVIDLESMQIAYQVPTKGFPQTSGILTTAYAGDTSKVYVYFFDNYTPGVLRTFSDEKGQTELKEMTIETMQTASGEKQYETGYTLFTPSASQAQYAICSPVVDEYGTMYFRNDSNYMMAVGSTIEKIEITENPAKMSYEEGDVFSMEGMVVTATYSNGMERDITDYVSYSTKPLTVNDGEYIITFESILYQNKEGAAGVETDPPMTILNLTITDRVSIPVIEIFSDVQTNQWFLDSVQYVYDHKIMQGVGNYLFAPYDTVTRATVVETLYKMEGKPPVDDFDKYDALTDLGDDDWWRNSVAWALNEGIATGYPEDMTFKPYQFVTRQELATFIYRYAQYKGLDVTKRDDLAGLQDTEGLSGWAEKQVKWAVAEKLITGVEVKDSATEEVIARSLDPWGNATRAQLATILMRFCETYK